MISMIKLDQFDMKTILTDCSEYHANKLRVQKQQRTLNIFLLLRPRLHTLVRNIF